MDRELNKKSSFFPMIIIGILFFIFGFVTWLNGSLIPFLKVICDLNDFQALFVSFALYRLYCHGFAYGIFTRKNRI